MNKIYFTIIEEEERKFHIMRLRYEEKYNVRKKYFTI